MTGDVAGLPLDRGTIASVVRAAAGSRDAVLKALVAVQSADAGVDPETLLPALFEANTAAQGVVRLLHQAGHVAPGSPAPTEIPLRLLDTPDSRELLALLEKAQAVAERVDAARGRALPEGTSLLPGESRGCDLAETISTIALRVRVEVCGPQGKE